jgi:hypothetical protein
MSESCLLHRWISEEDSFPCSPYRIRCADGRTRTHAPITEGGASKECFFRPRDDVGGRPAWRDSQTCAFDGMRPAWMITRAKHETCDGDLVSETPEEERETTCPAKRTGARKGRSTAKPKGVLLRHEGRTAGSTCRQASLERLPCLCQKTQFLPQGRRTSPLFFT